MLLLRKKHPLFRRRTYPKPEDTAWLAPEGREMSEPDWKLPFARCFGMLMVGRRLAERDERGNPVEDDDLLLLLNAHHDAIEFSLPDSAWSVLIDTARRDLNSAGKTYSLRARSLALLARPTTDRTSPTLQTQLERVREQLVARIDADAVVEPAGEAGLELHLEAVLALGGGT